MPEYLPNVTCGPSWECLLRNSGPRIVDLNMRAPGLRCAMSCKRTGASVSLTYESTKISVNFMLPERSAKSSPRRVQPDGKRIIGRDIDAIEELRGGEQRHGGPFGLDETRHQKLR